ncbi:DNA polymerase III subunit gamma/tau [Mycoplasmoides alvi]|uniref:DNA polymerase III subunit gamma/tau n=1 Tax=Mycoplasmoides alvi TaxID=78580 RepID=UPI000697004E|nr:DNA polymerase III subunit gamma/tau [Mycoplasmoides alvi]
MINDALYNKYRPYKFEDLSGENHIVKTLINAIDKNQISHAYLFCGPRGVGKTTVSKILSKAVNCLNWNKDVCNNCANCIKINNEQTMDVVELDAASNNGVSEIRQIIDNVHYLPTDLKIKVFILDEVHMLTTGAWNALLKTIEDCPKHVVFIFATTEYHKIPLTILSRCQCFSFKPLLQSSLVNLITYISEKESINITKKAIAKIANLANGAARDAITLLDQIKSYKNAQQKIDENDVNQIFGLLDEDQKIEFINSLVLDNSEKAIQIIDKFEESGINLNLLIQDTFIMFIDIYLYLKYKNFSILKIFNESNIKKIKIEDENYALQLANIWEDLTGKFKYNTNIKYNIELAIFKAMNLINKKSNFNSNNNNNNNNNDDDINTSKIHKKIEIKEKQIENEINTNKSSVNKFSVIQTQELINEIDDIFETKELIFNNNDKEKINTLDTLNKIDDIFLESTFFSIAKMYNKSLLNDYEIIFQKLKNTEDVSNDISFLLNYKKILLASDKGIVLLYSNDDEITFVNNHIFDLKFNKFIYDNFSKPLIIIGVTKEIAKKWTNNYKKIKDRGAIPDLNIDEISKSVLKNNKTKEFAENLFGDSLKYE